MALNGRPTIQKVLWNVTLTMSFVAFLTGAACGMGKRQAEGEEQGQAPCACYCGMGSRNGGTRSREAVALEDSPDFRTSV